MAPVLYRAPLFARTFLRNVPANFRASSSSAQPLIRLTNIPAPHSGTIRVLSLNRPETRNAISKALLSELIQHVNAIHGEGAKPTTRALVIASEIDTSFCAGADLKERATFTQDETADFLSKLRGAFTSLSQLPVPTISAVSSLAFGGGLELALTTHLRVFSSNAVVALPETRLGIIPGAGGTYRLPALIGLNRARDLVLTGRRVGGPEAYFIGLCDRLVQVLPEEMGQEGVARKKVLDEAVRVAMEICEGAPIAIRAGLAAVEGCAGGEAIENEMYRAVVDTEDRYEALAAFREKRKPVFKGR
ncbi:mitochondrial methylglutaconyl-hydratase [Diplodia corticola]|uniref:Mitochondrial methylglutaconyl-hydratase n=1 Tax=Diplodia corticola TaxID=236234 RepID=A0A1J9RQ33_9PEZI|nr:mitochondrial methylglutaconyl-hydratase [Diplodia corticola]OJD34675.1 mitochondrial methylglutaconyl-hydratase [Diplodia corticola]